MAAAPPLGVRVLAISVWGSSLGEFAISVARLPLARLNELRGDFTKLKFIHSGGSTDLVVQAAFSL